MEEEKKLVKRSLMDQEEFEKYLKDNNPYNLFYEKGILSLQSFECVRKFKSIRRAIRKGYMTPTGIICPSRPFNNRGNSSKRKGVHSREMNERKKVIYGQLKRESI